MLFDALAIFVLSSTLVIVVVVTIVATRRVTRNMDQITAKTSNTELNVIAVTSDKPEIADQRQSERTGSEDEANFSVYLVRMTDVLESMEKTLERMSAQLAKLPRDTAQPRAERLTTVTRQLFALEETSFQDVSRFDKSEALRPFEFDEVYDRLIKPPETQTPAVQPERLIP